VPGADWISVSLSNIVILNDPAALTRLDVTFRVLTYLSVQAFASVLYGQPGGQLRFQLTPTQITQLGEVTRLAQLAQGATPAVADAQQQQVLTQLDPLQYPPVVQAGVVVRLAL
jgi:hypothetical protein